MKNRGPRTQPCGSPRRRRRRWNQRYSGFGCDRFLQWSHAAFFLITIEISFSSPRPPSVLHQSEETQFVVMSLRRLQPCGCAVAYSNWIRVEISSLPVRLLKFSAWSSLSSISRTATARCVRGVTMKICQIQIKYHRRETCGPWGCGLRGGGALWFPPWSLSQRSMLGHLFINGPQVRAPSSLSLT